MWYTCARSLNAKFNRNVVFYIGIDLVCRHKGTTGVLMWFTYPTTASIIDNVDVHVSMRVGHDVIHCAGVSKMYAHLHGSTEHTAEGTCMRARSDVSD